MEDRRLVTRFEKVDYGRAGVLWRKGGCAGWEGVRGAVGVRLVRWDDWIVGIGWIGTCAVW